MKFGNINIKKQKCHQYKSPVLKNNIHIKKAISNKVSFGKKGFKFFIGYNDAKKLGLYAYFFQKWVYIEETLMICKKNIIKFGKKLETVSKKNLKVNLYTMKNIWKLK